MLFKGQGVTVWSRPFVEKAHDLLEQGLSNAVVAEQLGVTVAALQTGMTRFGLSKRTRANGNRRPCMCCQRLFYSQGKHNRLCPECIAENSSTVDDYTL